MASECCTKPGDRAQHSAQGSIKDVAGVQTYVTGSGKSAVIMFADIYGHTYINSQKVADQVADAGFTVYLPDEFNGNAFDPNDQEVMKKLGDWLKTNGPPHGAKITKPVVEHVLQQHSGQKIQMIGFCYGTKPITLLVEEHGFADKVSGVVFSHPSFATKEDADNWPNIPLFINEAEQDMMFVDDLREHWEKTLKQKNLITFERYPGTQHGFVVRPSGEQAQEASKKAIANLIEVLKKNQA